MFSVIVFRIVNLIHYASSSVKLQKLYKEMNKWVIVLTFLSGIIFAIMFSVIKQSLLHDPPWTRLRSQNNIGSIPSGANLQLMDDGYLLLADMGDENYGDHSLSTKQSTDLEDKNAELEALNVLKAAAEMTKTGKSLKAGKLLEHAFSLAPRHPDVLLFYGEYLEAHKNDVLQADQLYLKALIVSPANSHALQNRIRTLPVVKELDDAHLLFIDSKRDELALVPPYSGALRRIKKEAYFQQIYHTAAIEGNTLSLSETRMILETRLSVGGKSIMEHNEILGLDLALKYINSTLVHRIGKITLFDILEIHRRVLGHVDPLEAGHLRTTQVYVSNHIPPPPTKLQRLLEDFILWLNSEEALTLHPIRLAALVHYKFVFIHPFSDGNGRTARLLMNFILMQAGYPPIIIRKQDRMLYYEFLQTANEGDTRPFVRFIAHCTEKTLDVYLWATKEYIPEITQESHEEIKQRTVVAAENKQEKARNSEEKNRSVVANRSSVSFSFDSETNILGDESDVDVEPLWLSGKEEFHHSGSGRFIRGIIDGRYNSKKVEELRRELDELHEE